MNNILGTFKDRKAFVGYITGGDGGIDYTIECGLRLAEGGVDILEVGFPFSDPIADGPTIQSASKRALENGTNSQSILAIAEGLRKRTGTPLILFSYYNPILKMGEAYLSALYSAGFDAVLVLDLPPPNVDDHSHPHYAALKAARLHPIFIASPSTAESRLERVSALSDSFIYYACQKGTTGIRNALPDDFESQIARIRKKTSLPIAAGFGIADRSTALAAIAHADGFVVGSAFVNLMKEKASPLQLKLMAQAIDPRHLTRSP